MNDLHFTFFIWNNSDWLFSRLMIMTGSIVAASLILASIMSIIDEAKIMGKKFAIKHIICQVFCCFSLTLKKKNREMNKEILSKIKMIELEENKNKFFNSLLIDNLESKVEKINQIEDKIIHNKKMNHYS